MPLLVSTHGTLIGEWLDCGHDTTRNAQMKRRLKNWHSALCNDLENQISHGREGELRSWNRYRYRKNSHDLLTVQRILTESTVIGKGRAPRLRGSRYVVRECLERKTYPYVKDQRMLRWRAAFASLVNSEKIIWRSLKYGRKQ
jgi:hypothetical protein